jgi:IS30 family transposase
VVTKVNRNTSDQVSAAIVKQLKTITYDNGKEFAGHKAIDQSSGWTAYFADPFASWQRGSNENYNGLLRQYIPKKRHLSTITNAELKMIEDRLNHRPRKRLGFKTTHQVFHESLNLVALRT